MLYKAQMVSQVVEIVKNIRAGRVKLHLHFSLGVIDRGHARSPLIMLFSGSMLICTFECFCGHLTLDPKSSYIHGFPSGHFWYCVNSKCWRIQRCNLWALRQVTSTNKVFSVALSGLLYSVCLSWVSFFSPFAVQTENKACNTACGLMQLAGVGATTASVWI